MIGRVVGSYRIVEKIGEGGMGAVYRAVDEMLEREVAIKAIRPDLAREPQIVERFRAEAKILARVSHPAIATIYSFFYDGGELFLAMEFVRGRTLAEVLTAEGAMPWPRAVTLLCTALEGIEQAHRAGIIHRDLKPDNLMLTEAGTVKVMDFGIARMAGSNHLTRTGLLVGTLRYIAPEQIRGEEVDRRTDVYALGAVLYQMITGRVPFEGPSDYAILKAQIEDPPPPPASLVPDLPGWLDRAVLKALEKRPAGTLPDRRGDAPTRSARASPPRTGRGACRPMVADEPPTPGGPRWRSAVSRLHRPLRLPEPTVSGRRAPAALSAPAAEHYRPVGAPPPRGHRAGRGSPRRPSSILCSPSSAGGSSDLPASPRGPGGAPAGSGRRRPRPAVEPASRPAPWSPSPDHRSLSGPRRHDAAPSRSILPTPDAPRANPAPADSVPVEEKRSRPSRSPLRPAQRRARRRRTPAPVGEEPSEELHRPRRAIWPPRAQARRSHESCWGRRKTKAAGDHRRGRAAPGGTRSARPRRRPALPQTSSRRRLRPHPPPPPAPDAQK